MKKALKHEYDSFYASEQVYKDLDVPWKRGIIFLGASLLSNVDSAEGSLTLHRSRRETARPSA